MELATRGSRLGAAIIDGLVLAVPQAALGAASFPEPLKIVLALAILAIIGAQIYLLTTRGQTIGKLALSIRIVMSDNEANPGFVKAVLLRGIVNGILCIIPGYFIVDALFIFRGDKRCIHDFIAGTKVVAGNPAVA